MFPIRTRIFFGCISLTLVTILVGFLSLETQSTLGRTALGVYDDAFQSMNYLRSAQSIVLGIGSDIALGEKKAAVFVDQVQSALDALDVAHERAMSKQGEALTAELQSALSRVQSALGRPEGVPARSDFQAAEHLFDLAVSVYASDGFRLRRSAEDSVRATRLQTYSAMVGSILAAILITLILSQAIVPSIRRAVTVATAIAAGKLDNRIDCRGSSETGTLLTALAAMQDSIADKIRCIEDLMARQATRYDVAIASHNARFETALDHMTLGLRMFDADGGLLVENRRFAEMFDTGDAVAVLAGGSRPVTGEDGPYHRRLPDGRTIEVSEEAMAGGGRVVLYEDITERQRTEAQLSAMVRHDALTGLGNRLLFREHLDREMRRGAVSAVLCLDLDRFKMVNDTLGHPVGDALLRAAAERIRHTIGTGDLAVRLGGDEFAVIRGRAAPDGDAARLAERLIAAFSRPFDIDGHHISIGTSIGIADGLDGSETPDELLKNADLALYAAKAEGRGTSCPYRPEMNARVQDRRRLEVDLRAAIAGQQFEMHYQPLVSATTGAVVSFEALLRWHHPRRGVVMPGEFIPLAEEAGLIPAIGLWVLKRACLDATTWPRDVKVAINLSPLQFQYRNLAADVVAALEQAGLDPSRLDLEITESLMLQDSDVTLGILHDLRARGIGLAMDDFGTGYSSLSYLRRFPFDKIKIDRSFIRDMAESRDGQTIVEALVRLGQSLRMTVVAEGVETLDQKDILVGVGCQELQGYLFGRPQPASAVLGMIDSISMRHAA